VTADGRFIALLVTILTGLGIIMGGVAFCLRALWNIRGSWDRTNNELGRAVDKLTSMNARDDRLESRLERHLEWHDKH
jgi:hypothetical protein